MCILYTTKLQNFYFPNVIFIKNIFNSNLRINRCSIKQILSQKYYIAT